MKAALWLFASCLAFQGCTPETTEVGQRTSPAEPPIRSIPTPSPAPDAEHLAAQARIAAAEARAAEAEAQAAEDDLARAAAERRTAEIELELAQERARTAQTQAERDAALDEAAVAQARIAKLEDEIATLRARIDELEAQVERLQARVAELEAQLAELVQTQPPTHEIIPLRLQAPMRFLHTGGDRRINFASLLDIDVDFVLQGGVVRAIVLVRLTEARPDHTAGAVSFEMVAETSGGQISGLRSNLLQSSGLRLRGLAIGGDHGLHQLVRTEHGAVIRVGLIADGPGNDICTDRLGSDCAAIQSFEIDLPVRVTPPN